MKPFKDWTRVKIKLDAGIQKVPLVSERDVWWTSVGINVGSEINGKNELFSRPVLVVRKLSRYSFFVVPMSTKVRKGTWYEPVVFRGNQVVTCLHQARVIDYRRLSKKMGRLPFSDFSRVRKSLKELMHL